MAEDDENYASLIKNAFKGAGLNHKLFHVSDGSEAMAYLKGEGKYANRAKFPIPCVILVDLKMPKVNGYELLEWIRHHAEVPHLPVIVLTLTDEIRDIEKAYCLVGKFIFDKPAARPRLESGCKNDRRVLDKVE